MDYISILNKFLALIAGYFIAIFDPISGMVYALLLTMAANCLIGIFADREQGNKYSFKKMFKAFKEYAFITGGAFFSAAICTHMDSMSSGTLIMKTIVWAAILLYAKNIVRNAAIIFPDSKFLNFFSWLIDFKFVKKNEYLNEYLTHQKNKENENNRT